MTIKKRLARSNLMMLIVPVVTAGVLLVIGLAAALFLLQTVYLPAFLLGIAILLGLEFSKKLMRQNEKPSPAAQKGESLP